MVQNARFIIQKFGRRIGVCAVTVLAAACGLDSADGEDGDLGVGTSAVTNPSNNQLLSNIHRCYMPTFGDGDHMSTNKLECPAGTDEGQMFYVPSASEVGTHGLYRLYKASGLDHMDSTVMGEGGYSTEFTLGYPFDGNPAGTSEIRRWYKPGNNDHVTAFYGENPAVYGYNQESIMGYGYKRYGKSGESLVTMTGSSVVLKANVVAGGAITELKWNNKQFINNWDYGRQIQTAISLESGNSSEMDNPTEAGDHFGWPAGQGAGSDAGWSHGSPLLSASVVGETLATKTSPLQWKPESFGGDQYHPVRWKGTISKAVTLDFGGSSNAIQYVTNIYFPMAQNYVRSEVVTAYLTSEFTKFYLYDAATDKLTNITGSCPAEGSVVNGVKSNGYAKMKGSQSGGIIIATADGLYALGGYHKDPGYNAWYQCGNFTNRSGTGKYGDATTKWSVFGKYPEPGVSTSVVAGTTSSYTNYLTVGTLTTAWSEMRKLYLAGK
jgi:hypothetical protein